MVLRRVCKLRLASPENLEIARHYLFTFSIKHEIRYFHVVVAQKRQRNEQKSVMHVQSCCFAY